MAKSDFYDTLGIGRGCSAGDIKKAYRKLAMQFHPDRNPGNTAAEHKFKDLNQAYDILKDPEKRAAYDRFGHAAFEEGGPGGPPGGAGAAAAGAGFDFGSGFADIFEEMFGDFMGGAGGARRSGSADGGARGSDLRYNLKITLEDAHAGKQAQIKVPTLAQCGSCNGSGAASGAKPINCPTCHGRGRVRAQQGFFTIERTCPNCHGGGQVISNPCTGCGGQGRVRKEKTLSVSIPAGVDEGTRIRLSGEGEAGMRGAPAGDLYLFIGLKPHPFFHRDGANIYCRVPIPMTTAALGGTIEVPTVEGKRARVTIPSGSQTGDQFRLRGKGMSVLRAKSHGDMFIEIAAETPVNLNKRQKDLLAEFNKAGGRDTHPESEGFFSKVKELWEDLKE